METHNAYTGDVGRPWALTFRVNGAVSDISGGLVSIRAQKPSGSQVVLTGCNLTAATVGQFEWAPRIGDVDSAGVWVLHPTAIIGSEVRHGDPIYWSVGAAMPRDFLPSHLGDLVVWLRGDRGVTLTSGAVSAWADQSPQTNDVSQGTAGDRPTMTTLGGQDALLFTSSDYLHGSGFTGLPANTEFTEFVVGRLTDLTGTYRFAHELGTNGGINTGFSLLLAVAAAAPLPASAITFRVEPAAPSDVGYAFSDTTNPHIWTCQHTGAGRSISENGVGQYSVVSAHTSDAITQHRVGLSLFGTLDWVGEIAEIITYARALDLDELARVHDYLGARYGITVP